MIKRCVLTGVLLVASLSVLAPAARAGPLVPGPPAAPTEVVATPGVGQVSLSWLPPVDDGGSAVTDYAVQMVRQGAAETRMVGSATTSFDFVGLTDGVAHWFRVAAVNEHGTGVQSHGSDGVVPGPVSGAPATGVSVVRRSEQVEVSWTAPTDTGGAELTDYLVRAHAADGGLPSGVQGRTQFVESTATSYVFFGLTNGTGYRFSVTPVISTGTGPESELSAAVVPATTPNDPYLVLAPVGDGQSRVSWYPGGLDGGSAVNNHQVRVLGASSDVPTGVTGPTTRLTGSAATSFVFTGLTNGTTYRFVVAAVNDVGVGRESWPSGPVTPAPAPRPDARIQRGSLSAGNNIYNNNGVNQTFADSTRQRSVTYTISLQNDGLFAEVMRLRGQGSSGRFTVVYRTVAGANVTNRVVAGTYASPMVAPGATHNVRATLTMAANTPRGASLYRRATVRSTRVPSVIDVVAFEVTRL